jgi:hypothetical protein
MEVFGAIYDTSNNPIVQEQAMVLDQTKWNSLINQPTICIGNGHLKTKDFTSTHVITYLDGNYTSQVLLDLAMAKWTAGQFEDLALVQRCVPTESVERQNRGRGDIETICNPRHAISGLHDIGGGQVRASERDNRVCKR